MIAYRATLDVRTELVRYVANLLRAERRRRQTRKGSRLLTCWKQAVFVLAWFRKKDECATRRCWVGWEVEDPHHPCRRSGRVKLAAA